MPVRMARCRRDFRFFPNRSSISKAWASAAACCIRRPTTTNIMPPGHFWMTLLDGRHVSSDVAVVRGKPRWWRHVTGKAGRRGHLRLLDRSCRAGQPLSRRRAAHGSKKIFAGYTGMLNLETIGGKIIEAHLRFADQWPDLYGPGWVEALVELYERGDWNFPDDDRARATASFCSARTAGAIAIRRRQRSKRSSACQASPACRSPSMRIARRSITPCRPADFASPSSTALICRRPSPRARDCGNFSSFSRPAMRAHSLPDFALAGDEQPL